MHRNEGLRYKIATIYLKEISKNGRYTQISYLNKLAKDSLLSESSEEEEIRTFGLFNISAKDLLLEQGLLVLSEKGNYADLTQEGYKAAKFDSITEYFSSIENKEIRKNKIEIGAKIAEIISAIVAVIAFIIGYITNNINIGLLIVTFLMGLIIGFVINDIIKRIA